MKSKYRGRLLCWIINISLMMGSERLPVISLLGGREA
jgi:hypothetical protein